MPVHFASHPELPLFLYTSEIWHPVAAATKDRSPEGRLVVNVRFSDGTDDMVLNADEGITIATPPEAG